MPKSATFSRFDIATACGLFAVTLALYVRTLAPGLLFGDGGELQTLTYTLGSLSCTPWFLKLFGT